MLCIYLKDKLAHESDEHLSDDHLQFSTLSVHSDKVTDMYESILHRPIASGVEEPVLTCQKIVSEIDRTVSERMGTKLPSFDPNNDSISIPSGIPIVHEIISNDHCVFTSFDIETGGELCGIVQILAELCQFELGADGGLLSQRMLQNISRYLHWSSTDLALPYLPRN